MKIITPHIKIEGYKPSQYNCFVLYEDDSIVVFNFLYRSLLLFDKFEAEEITSGTISTQILQVLINQHIFILETWDEWSFYQYNYLSQSYNVDKLSLAIMPTLGCNCACP